MFAIEDGPISAPSFKVADQLNVTLENLII